MKTKNVCNLKKKIKKLKKLKKLKKSKSDTLFAINDHNYF